MSEAYKEAARDNKRRCHCVGEVSAGTRASALGALGLVIGPMTLGPCIRVPWGMCYHQEDSSFQADQSPMGPPKCRADRKQRDMVTKVLGLGQPPPPAGYLQYSPASPVITKLVTT